METQKSVPERRGILLLLALVAGLKVLLMLGGGSRYAPDEFRYDHAIAFAHALGHGEVAEAGRVIADHPEHAGFTVVMLPAVLVQAALEPVTGHSPYESDWVPLLLLAGASLATLPVLAAVARHLGLDPRATLIALLLLAGSASWQRYSRHLLPYDLSLLCLMLATWCFTRPGGARGSRSLGTGVLCGAAFLIYNGYWTAVAVTGAAAFLAPRCGGLRPRIRHGLLLTAGALLPVLLLEGWARLGGGSMLAGLGSFADTVDQGDWADGVWIPLWYAWASDHGLLLLWAAWIGALGWRKLRGGAIARVEWACLTGVAILYGLWTLGSNGLEQFVVYGRITRSAWPWLALGTAAWLGPRVAAFPPLTRHLLSGILVLQAAFNLWTPLGQHFPADALARARTEVPDLQVALTWTGPGLHAPEELAAPASHILYNHRFLYPLGEYRPPVEGRILWSRPHPAGDACMQYNGYSRRERALLHAHPPRTFLLRKEPAP